MPDPRTPDAAVETLPLLAPCRTLGAWAPLDWVRRGWRDLRRAPRQSLTQGAIITALSWVVAALALRLGGYWVVLIMLSGFVFVAPVLALGVYSISRQLERGERPSLRRCLVEQRRGLGTAMVFALVLLVVFLVWARAASMVHVFFPVQARPEWTEVVPFLLIGSAVGSVFAALSFAITAFSLPMICDRDVDAVTAVVTSINAVLRNKPAMAVWVAVIVASVAVGFLTLLFGLALTMPLIGHATWHAYRDTVDASAWPLRQAEQPR